MNIINLRLSLPYLTKSNVNFDSLDVDESCGDMSIKFSLNTDGIRFDELINYFHDRIRHEYYPRDYEIESEFEESLNRDIDLVITMTDYGNYEFNLFNFADNDELYFKIQIDLNSDEIELFKPYMYKYFEPDYQLEQIRQESVQTINTVIPKQIRDKFKLIVDRLDGVRYRSCWESSNSKQSIICELLDYTKQKCPITITKFGF